MALLIDEQPTPDVDWTCQRIAEYLRHGLNADFVKDQIEGLRRQQVKYDRKVAAGIEPPSTYFSEQIHALTNNLVSPTPVAVVGVRSYDAFNVPLHEFPLLKVYRTQDLYQNGKLVSTSPVIAAYCLCLPDQEHLQGSLRWASKKIAKLLTLSQQQFCVITDGDRRAEYRTLINEMAMPVYSFMRFYFTIKD